ncbi:MAG: efflux RND transporter periplasmic adaptor subunit [Prevotella sp.]
MRTNKLHYTLILLLLATQGFMSCKESQDKKNKQKYPTMVISTSDQTIESTYPATISGLQDVDIYPQIEGLITQVCVDEGANVKKGQTLFILDQVPYNAAVYTAKANVESAEAAVANASLTVESKKMLYKDGVISAFDLKTACNTLRQSQASLSQAKSELVKAENNLSYTVIKSPVDGKAGMTRYRVGALVGPGITTPLMTVSDNKKMHVYFSMTEKQLLSLTRQSGGTENIIKDMPQVGLVLNDGKRYELKGCIDAISGITDSKTGTVTIRATFTNNGILRSGGQGNIVVPTVKKDCIVIPQEATYELQDKIFVYTIVHGKTKARQINVLPINNGKTYIVDSGLEKGDVIISSGAGLLREGTEVSY